MKAIPLATLVTVVASLPAQAVNQNLCAAFPAVAQSFTPTSTLTINGTASILQHTGTEFGLGFGAINPVAANSCNNNQAPFACKIDTSLIVAKQPNIVLPASTRDMLVNNGVTMALGVSGECQTENSTACSYNDITITDGTLFLKPGIYWFNNLNMSATAQLKIGGEVTLYANNITLADQSVINPDTEADVLAILTKGNITLADTSSATALLYSEARIELGQNAKVIGATTAANLQLNDSAQLRGQSQCFIAPSYSLTMTPINDRTSTCSRVPVTFTLQDQKNNLQPLTGTLNVTASSANACWAGSETGACSGSNQSLTLTNGQATLWLEHRVPGQVNVSATFTSPEAGELHVSGGNYIFEASGFRISPSTGKVIAGKAQPITIEATSGDCGGPIDPNYTGTKTLVIGKASYISPEYQENEAPEEPLVNDLPLPQTLQVEFVNGRAENAFAVTYYDAGSFSLPIQEVAAKASESTTTAQPMAAKSLSGIAVFHVRPYTLAICSVRGVCSRSLAVDAFNMAGAPFSVALKPVIWQRGDPSDDSVIALDNSYCYRDTTPSFSKLTAPATSVTFDAVAKVTAPTNGYDGKLTGFNAKANIDITGDSYEFTELTIDEVGRFKLRARVATDYLGMQVNESELEIGRFFPSHFLASSDIVSAISPLYDTEGRGFNYMDQTFSGKYTVKAMSAQNVPLKNYHLYLGENERALFDDYAIDLKTNRELSTRWNRPSLGNLNQWKVGTDGTSEVTVDGSMLFQRAAYPDGPYSPLHFAIAVMRQDRDGTQFKFCDETVTTGCNNLIVRPATNEEASVDGAELGKIEVLFGRMRLEGFTETKDFISEREIPVFIEYFNQDTFETNTRDNASLISKNIEQKDLLFSDSLDPAMQAKILLRDDAGNEIDTKTVEQGLSAFVVIPPSQEAGLNREQFKYWQLLDLSTSGNLRQPWLQFNWEGQLFDDDPSAIVTYGFYQGNDRIIYRGEKNIRLTEE